jgi:GTPase SAR1 family protein
VTNGTCWCFYPYSESPQNADGNLLFPFERVQDAERLYEIFSEVNVENGSLNLVTNEPPRTEDRLLSIIFDADGRVDRNSLADHILPALNNALYADALLSNQDSLEKCFVATEGRTKFDSYLEMHLADPKPAIIQPAKRIRKGKQHDHLEEIVEQSTSSHAPPVTLIIGPVGAGKTTYLKHFELISGRHLLESRSAHWINIDFEEMGRTGQPRAFLYEKLRTYLAQDHPTNPTDYKNAVDPAYVDDIAGLARGPLAPIFTNKALFNQKVSEHITRDYEMVEPYVDKIFRFLASKCLIVVVLDNIDLYEDDELERTVFAEGLALSKRIFCNIFVSIRDTTFVKHQADATFDAYELRKLWLDPPPFKAVLSNRLIYSKKILQKKFAKIYLHNGMAIDVPDLSVFFDIVQRSILQGPAGDFIDYLSDLNIRRGLKLVTNFLTSGHIQAFTCFCSCLKRRRLLSRSRSRYRTL